MEQTLVTFFGLSESHAKKIMALDEQSRQKKIEELRAFRECSRIEF